MLCTTFVALGVVCGPNRSNKFSLLLFCCVPLCGLRGGVLDLSQIDVRPSTAIYAALLRTLPHATARAARRQTSLCFSCPYLLISAHRRSSPHIAAHRRTSLLIAAHRCTSLYIAARRNVAARCNVVTRRFTMSLTACRRMLPHVACRRCLMSPHVAAYCCMMLHDTL
jgi:hypothetical protein